MQDPTAFQPMKPQFPEQEQLKCPRCDSANTKFCYYNNYNLSQPRYFCKNCRRYWTKGGALRNIPVGGGSRKNTKRSSSSTTTKRPPVPSSSTSTSPSPASVSVSVSSTARPAPDPNPFYACPSGPVNPAGSLSSLLASTVPWGGLWEGLNSNGSGSRMMQLNEFGENVGSGHVKNSDSGRNPGLERQSNGNSESFLGKQNVDSSCWNGSSNGWSDLAIYTPGSSYQ